MDFEEQIPNLRRNCNRSKFCQSRQRRSHPGAKMLKKLMPPSTIERYFTLHYGLSMARKIGHSTLVLKDSPRGESTNGSKTEKCDVEKNVMKWEDTCIARHHNGICVVCLSPQHPVVQQNLVLRSITYRVPFREVHGKRKRGGLTVERETRLCTLICDSGEEFVVKCAVKGMVVEYNTALETNPSLVVQRPLTDGYLAVVLPPRAIINTAVASLMCNEEYQKLWKCYTTNRATELG